MGWSGSPMSTFDHNRSASFPNPAIQGGRQILLKCPSLARLDCEVVHHTMANKFIQAKIDLETILGYSFEDDDILREALWAAGPGSAGTRKFLEGNKMLALVGDTAMKTILLHHSYTKGRMRGETDRAMQSALCNANLNNVGRANAVGQYIVLNNINSTVSKNMMATTVEAVFGAVFEDSGMDLEAMRRGMIGFGLLE
ncbi:hypothetical protein DOTSEDRAFT_73478 [Dothistroma septosporum NZE10]|uniref:RNase III domain-containing protein n=1 Tax=Dothistroma septosporum (strain NZE10 / CBS 128990) TaxID=675120 RepID=N1PJU0_DOTSN|nr:hypothetical protein DOTSEDRAFT_73478 [Dothistroma septosporum NZE10]